MKKAFTMIELIIVIVILGIVAGLGVEIIKFSYDNEKRVRALNELELSSQATMDFLTTHLNNSVRFSYRLKKAEDSDCNSADCVFPYKKELKSMNKGDFKAFEWARIDMISKKKGYWDGLNETKSVIEDSIDATKNCYVARGKFHDFYCFSNTKSNSSIVNNYKAGTVLGLTFLEDNGSTSSTFMEKDLYRFEILKDKKSKIVLNLGEKSFSMTSVYALIDKIEGIVYDKSKKELQFYSYDYKDATKNFSSANKPKSILAKHVQDFTIEANSIIPTITICLERDDLPGSFIHKKTSIKVCKSGVIL